MKRFFMPLWVFVIGQLVVLIVTLLLPAVTTQVATLDTETQAIGSNFWGWEWLMTSGVVRWLIYITMEGAVLFATGKAFLATRRIY